jgi:hypothetical protein
MDIVEKHPSNKRNSNLQPLHRRPPRTCLTVNGCRGQHTGNAIWNPGNGTRQSQNGLQGLWYAMWVRLMQQHWGNTFTRRSWTRRAVFLGVICANCKTAEGQATLSFCKFAHELWWSYVKILYLIYFLHQPREYKVLSASHIWVHHSSVSEEQCHLECEAVTLCYYFPTFRRNTLLSSWVVKESTKNKFIRNLKDIISNSTVERQEHGEH